MRRRGNKSSKVPNVKLRPAQAVERSTRESESFCWAEDSQRFSDSIVDLCPRPFKGVVLCATGIADKPTLFKQAVELGATHFDVFTDRVTHLIAVGHGGAKYKCALERKLPIVLPSWITESYQIWLRGDDVDVNEFVEEHRLPVFSGVVMSLSGITDIARRTEINKLLTRQQGVYVKNVERPVKVTHLLCTGDEETDKMRCAEKFNKKGEANIHLIWEEWFWDCLEFGGRFDEKMYQIQEPRPGRKSLPEDAAPNTPMAAETLPEGSHPQEPASSQDQEDPEEVAIVKRLPAVTLQVWESLLKPRGYEISSGKLIRSPSKSQQPQRPATPPSPTARRAPAAGGSIISTFRRANSFAPQQSEASGSRQPFRRASTLVGLPPKASPRPERPNAVASSSTAGVSCCPSLFSGLMFRTVGEARCANVHAAIQGSGGHLASENTLDDADYVVVRLVSGSKLFRQESDERERKKYRTECWLERCIYEERICSPDEHRSFIPLDIETPVDGAERVHLSLSGFHESELWALRRLIRALGINQAPNFSRRTTHLLCPSGTGAKFDKAQEWSIPVVNMQWLIDVSTTGVIHPVAEYRVCGPPPPGDDGHQLPVAAPEQEKIADLDFEMAEVVHEGAPSKSTPTPSGSLRRRKPPEAAALDDNNAPPTQPPNPSPAITNASTLEYVTNPNSPLLHNQQSDEHVPSSETPSPMKLPVPVSPAKVPDEVTRALQDNIASLLGKRLVPEQDPGPGGGGRAGKRLRPPSKTKLQWRKPSEETLATSAAAPAAPLADHDHAGFGDFELPVITSMETHVTEESMRVTYEDPGERDEMKRLMSLLERQGEGDDTTRAGRRKGKAPARRSLRVAGF